MRILLPLLFPLLILAPGSLLPAGEDRPNVLFIAVDDLRPELGCYGAPFAQTPHIDRLAATGSRFSRAYCNIPVCGASRASLLGGVRPGYHRYLHYYTWLEKETPEVLPLHTHFQRNGYRTVSLGKVFHHARDHAGGWDRIDDAIGPAGWRDYVLKENTQLDRMDNRRGPPVERADVLDNAYRDGKLAEMAVAELENMAKTGESFFLAVGFVKPHLPFNAPEKYWRMYNPEAFPVPPAGRRPSNAPAESFHGSGELRAYDGIPREGPVSDAMARLLIHGYHACVSYVDAQVGKLLDALEATGLADNTIVVLWGDHGWNLREHGIWCKHCLYETSLHVPLIFRAPGIAPSTVPGITEFVDIYPTLCELTGLAAPGHLDGQSLVPLMRDPTRPGDGVAVAKWFEGTTVIRDSFFYTEWRNEADEPYARMLYDHRIHPAEMHNLAEDPAYRKTVRDLSRAITRERGDAFFEPVAQPSPR